MQTKLECNILESTYHLDHILLFENQYLYMGRLILMIILSNDDKTKASHKKINKWKMCTHFLVYAAQTVKD